MLMENRSWVYEDKYLHYMYIYFPSVYIYISQYIYIFLRILLIQWNTLKYVCLDCFLVKTKQTASFSTSKIHKWSIKKNPTEPRIHNKHLKINK